MSSFSFIDAYVLIADSTEISALTVRNLLHNQGFREFTITRTIADTQAALDDINFDLLVTSTTLEDQDIAPYLHQLRQGDMSHNPFVPVIALAWEPSIDEVAHLLNCGVDIILTQPLTGVKVSKAVNDVVARRKPFVVTADYIGPERRQSPRPNTMDTPKTIVPNPLKRKATGKDIADNHDIVLDQVYNQRVESFISRITFIIGKISGLTSGDNKGTLQEWLVELNENSAGLLKHITQTRYAHQEALCQSLIDVTESLIQGNGLNVQDLELLQQIALALEIATKQYDASTIHAAQDIEKMIDGAKKGKFAAR